MRLTWLLISLGCLSSSAFAEVNKDGKFEDLKFHGFDLNREGSESEARQAKGLQNIFDGKGFRVGFPLRAAEFLEAYKQTKNTIESGVSRIKGEEHISATSDLKLFTQLGKLPSPPTRQGMSFRNKNYPVPDLMAGIGVYDDVVFKNTNCFMCHSGVVDGIVTAGLPNSHTDQVGYSSELSLLLKVRPLLENYLKAQKILHPQDKATIDKELKELGYYLDDMQAETRDVLSKAVVRGDNMGPYVVWKKLSRLIDPANQGFLTYKPKEASPFDSFFAVDELPPVDPNPWWTRAFKSTSYRYAEPAEYIAAHFSLNFTKPTAYVNQYHEQHVKDVSDILYYAEHLTSPAYPRDLDADKVELGRQLFHGEASLANGKTLSCNRCHGDYSKDSDSPAKQAWLVNYPDKGLIDVGTDSAYNKLLQSYAALQKHGEGFKSYFDDQDLVPELYVPAKSGYIAPPLVGVWASAPYFHNGSVPTLYQVLNSSARAEVWSRTQTDPFAYNHQEVGLDHSTITISDADYAKWKSASRKNTQTQDASEFRAWYNTKEAGRSNAGHSFGDAMNDTERYAVIEFLKAVSGENVKSQVAKPKKFYKFSE